ncbi:transcription initiation factor TFIID subunit 5, putative [Entamoeba histolytica HM-1:IMSS]|uniref:Transcription initiation factor TFIID subunit 5, putative n=2 Tax=Entamoeba histolytica TaxID=5759 RepID=C4LWU2_ENTH1|nr:transcription initiation factor TFIID subunit 5, putative [Entamoeba histolytica HM-1:IMSS]EAL49597.2 transcription initiation factor TFIID subunit 5, putative [Entamoeba histolytica HM-1:IMSS]EMD46058.1 transcription initiation factor TFIID subunit, putative [Entamoeba histolytica KU27]|eukprot:XP_654985.2 transcription initiation factor TFIID subunit 5, putative [Entamoeba histolytica HM-1:IMSS]
MLPYTENIIQKPSEYTYFKFSQKTQERIYEDEQNRILIDEESLPSTAFFTFFNSQNVVNSVNFSDDGHLISVGCSDSSIRLYDFKKTQVVNGMNPQAKLLGHCGPVFSTNNSPDFKWLVSGSEDCSVRLWSLDYPSCIMSFNEHDGPVWDVQYCPLEYYMLSSSYDKTARLWTSKQNKSVRIFGGDGGHSEDVTCSVFTPDALMVITGSADKTIKIWDVGKGKKMADLTGHDASITSLAISSTGRYLASGDEKGSVILWDIKYGEHVKKIKMLKTSNQPIISMAFSNAVIILVTCCNENYISLWNIQEALHETESKHKLAMNSADNYLIKQYNTKDTPVIDVQFTRRNLLLAAGIYNSPE